MSGNCFKADIADFGDGSVGRREDNILSKNESVLHIQKIEEDLITTQNRCETLSEQLLYLKRKCKEKEHQLNDGQFRENIQKEEMRSKQGNGKENPAPPRQNPKNILTDTSGAAIKTMNSILTGISVSVNRGSKFEEIPEDESSFTADTSKQYDDMCSLDTKTKTLKSVSGTFTKSSKLQLKHSDKTISTKNNSCIKMKVKLRNSKEKEKKIPKNKNKSLVSLISKRRTPLTARTLTSRTSNNFKLTKESEHNSLQQQGSKRKRAAKRTFKSSRASSRQLHNILQSQSCQEIFNNNLVELYHNVAVKDSDSDESQHKKTKARIPRSKSVIEQQPAHPIQLPTVQTTHALTPIQEQPAQDDALHSESANQPFNDSSRNYQLPTFASRMRQAAKRYLSNFSFRTIPFCVATSTTQSHNIGLNIQQVMSIIKMKQPLTGISPTLAHNINLAAGKLQSRPFSTLVSTISSKIGYGRSQCPLLEDLDYGHLQEMAREIQDVPNQDLYFEENAENAIVCANGPSGDPQSSMWTKNKERCCTCIHQPGVSFDQMFHKYHLNSETVTPPKLKLDQLPETRKNYTRRWVRGGQQKLEQPQQSKEELRGREKNLKAVLQNLHNEFDNLNNTYEDLARQLDEGSLQNKPEAVCELLKLEKNLNNKEEEIKMVMNLYTEVLALQDQVKRLQSPATNTEEDPKAVLHLTQLLKQVKSFQMRYKNMK